MNESVQRPQPGLEIATTGDGRDITRPYAGGMLLPADRVLAHRGGDLLVYEQVLSDPQVKACFEQRRNAVTRCEWYVEAASDRRIDRKAADWLRRQLQRIGWDRITDRMLYGVFYGYAVAELVWQVQDGLLGWQAVKVRNRRRFRFAADGSLRLVTPQRPWEGEPAPAPYFWAIATGADHDDEPYGVGLGHWCYWPVLFKRNGIAFWLVFLEKFGAPTALGRFDPGATPEERQRLLAALRAIRTDAGVIIPKGMEIELLEAARSGTGDYKTLHDTMDETIAKAILGQTMTTDNGSSKSQAEVHMEVRQDIVKADADLICESFNLGPVRWLTMFNFAGAEPPRVFRRVEEPEDASTIAERDAKVAQLGFRPSLDYIRQTYGDHWEERTATPAASAGEPAAAFAEPERVAQARADAQARLDAIAAGAAQQGARWREFVEPRVRELQVLLDESGDLEVFRERLVELAAQPAAADFVEALARAGFGAHLLGRSKGA